MPDGLRPIHQSALLQVFDDLGVGFLHKHAGKGLDFRLEPALQIDHVAHRDPFLQAEFEVIDAIGGGGMDDAGAVLDRDEIRIDHEECRLVRDQVPVEGLVALAQQAPGIDLGLHLVVALQDGEARLRQDVPLVALPHPHVRDVEADRQGNVPRERPGGGRPGQEVGLWFVFEFEFDVDRGVFDVVLISEGELMAGERGCVMRTIGNDFEPLVEQLLVPELLEDPPDRFHVRRVIGAIRVLEIDPEPHLLGHLRPLVDVLKDALPAELVERFDAVPLDVLLAVEFQRLLDFDLDRQPVGVPATFAFGVESAHGLVAGKEILHRAGQHMMDAGKAVGRGRAFVEDEKGPTLPLFDASGEDVLLFPEAAHVLFHLGEVGARGDFLEHGRKF